MRTFLWILTAAGVGLAAGCASEVPTEPDSLRPLSEPSLAASPGVVASGTWHGTLGSRSLTLELQEAGDVVSGTMAIDGDAQPASGTIFGADVSLLRGDGQVQVDVTISGDQASGVAFRPWNPASTRPVELEREVAPPPPPPPPPPTGPQPIDNGVGDYHGLPLVLASQPEPMVDASTPFALVCVGMSNSRLECDEWIATATGLNPNLSIVDCAIGGHPIEVWADPTVDPRNGQPWNNPDPWQTCINQTLPAHGFTAEDVRVVWHKAANGMTRFPDSTPRPTYPHPDANYWLSYANHSAFAPRVQEHFSNVEVVYTTSRSYGGFATPQSKAERRGEPLSYEEGHALNSWLADNPEVDGVPYLWGPYIWAPECGDGVNGSGVCYEETDFRPNEGVHPIEGGLAKIAQMLELRFGGLAWYR